MAMGADLSVDLFYISVTIIFQFKKI